MKSIVTIETKTGSFSAYLSVPQNPRAPGLIVLPEIYNSNEHIRAIADRFAEEGYLSLAPDVFWRLHPNRYLPYTPDGLKIARELNEKLDVDQLVEDLATAIASLRNHPKCSGLVGSVGFCLGGKLSFLCAARNEIHAAVSYYGVNIESYLEEVEHVTCPTLLHFAGNDPRVPPASREAIENGISSNPNISTRLYEGAEHGFNRLGHPPYHKESADLAWRRTISLFDEHLT